MRTPYSGEFRLKAFVVVLTGLLLATLLPEGFAAHPAYAQTAGSSVDFAENRTSPIAAFLAYDQDGDAIDWSLGGPDSGLFTIDGGVLAFEQPPSYEKPQSRSGGNVYRVTVQAGGGTHDVTVRVTDVDEAGTASIDRRQPQVSRPLAAVLSDEDDGVSDERWQWARSRYGRTWTDIEGATSPRRSPEEADEGMYLRAAVTYSDRFGAGKTALAVSARRVEARTLSNAAPSFVDRRGNEVTAVPLRVAENTAVGRSIGRRVTASDADRDLLFYELLDTPDLEDDDGVARFTIDSATGQVRVGKVLGADAGETEDEDSNGEYVLRVRASDPSTASATVGVIVRITNVNEPPDFAEDVPTLLKVVENVDPPVITAGDGGVPIDDPPAYAATDQDASDTIVYSVLGDDEELLDIDRRGVLSFEADHEIDHETKSSYSIIVRASSRGRSTSLDVTIEVVDGDDAGTVLLSQRQPQVGREVSAVLRDPDGGVRVAGWQWERSGEITEDDEGTPSAECRDDPDTTTAVVGGWTEIAGASTSVYTPEAADAGRCLRATAVYTDNLGSPGDTPRRATGVLEAPTQAGRSANAGPEFVDQDMNTPGDQSDRTSRKIAVNTDAAESIGAPVSAFDEDDGLLVYTLGGTDAAFFDISRDTGLLMTKASRSYAARNSYSVVVTVTDPSGASDSILVTINVTNVRGPVTITGPRSVRYPENGTGPLASYTAFDEAGHVIRWSLGGRDDDLFTIDGGVLAFREPPNYEDPLSASTSTLLSSRNRYLVTVEAAGGTRAVSVTVTDVDEAGAAGIDRPQPQVSRLLTARLLDEDGPVTDELWQWARSRDARTWTDIAGATEPERRPVPADEGMYLRATVTYSDKFGTGRTDSAVTLYPVEAATTANTAPSFAGQDDVEPTSYIDIARSVPENTAVGMPVGDPVSALDPDEDILFYELVDTPDLEDGEGRARFAIDSLTGQIRVARVLGADPGETEDEDSTALAGVPALPGDEDADEEHNSEYVLRVRASDPSTASATVNVIVTVTRVNEPPAFPDDAPTLLSVVENVDPPVIRIGRGVVRIGAATYAATDPDGTADRTVLSVSGADGDDFDIESGILSFRPGHEPDFEDQRSYSITLVARSGEGARSLSATLDVIIEVVDGEDMGVVVLSQRQPEVGVAIHATVSDEDGGVTISRRVWELSELVTVNDRGAPSAECLDDPDTPGIDVVDEDGWTAIAGASSAVYAPKAADVGRCLRTRVTYVDNVGRAQDTAVGVLEVPVGTHGSSGTAPASDGGFVNAAPTFPDQDFHTEGDQSDRTSRQVPENTPAGRNIGAPVSAIDDDGDLLIYTLTGPDAGLFRMGRKDGQLTTRAPLDFEDRSTYSVVVTAIDPFGAMDTIEVTIKVTDEDDPAVITVSTGG